jgi:hypothetical protein
MPEVLIEAVSPYGFKVNGAWMNFDNKAGLKKEDYHAGDAVELTLNPKGFISGVKVVTSAPPKKAFAPGGFKGGSSISPERSAAMSRGAAVKAVLDLPNVHRAFDEKDDAEALAYAFELADKVAQYIEKGN